MTFRTYAPTVKLNLCPAVLLYTTLSIPVRWEGDTSPATGSWVAVPGQGYVGGGIEGAWQVLWLERLTLKGHAFSLVRHELLAAPIMKMLLSM